jgi:hypothetical protein
VKILIATALITAGPWHARQRQRMGKMHFSAVVGTAISAIVTQEESMVAGIYKVNVKISESGWTTAQTMHSETYVTAPVMVAWDGHAVGFEFSNEALATR